MIDKAQDLLVSKIEKEKDPKGIITCVRRKEKNIMNKNTLWLMFVLLAMYLALVFCEEQQQQEENSENTLADAAKDLVKSESTALFQDEARTRRRHRHHLCKFF